jgi:NAD/NADP transhydrogenase alpha subunit
MPIRVGVPKEIVPGERRVAVVPGVAARLKGLGVEVVVQKGAGENSGISDQAFGEVQLVEEASQLYRGADVVLKVSPPTLKEVESMEEGTIVIGFLAPHMGDAMIKALRDRHMTGFALELVPRISRAQSMDALSSQAVAAGYKAVLLAAQLSGRFFPMLTTAAGTIRPATVLVIGAGVAGLQAIATARRLGAIVEAYDVRAPTKEQVQSLGAKFLESGVRAEGVGGYARELTEEEKNEQQKLLAEHIAKADVVIATAAVPGKRAPRIIAKQVVEGMKGGAVIIDLAAESGGNCELTRPGKTVVHRGVIVHGPLNVPSLLAYDASELYARNLFNLLGLMIKDGEIKLNFEDEVIRDSALTHGGRIMHEPTRKRVEGGA